MIRTTVPTGVEELGGGLVHVLPLGHGEEAPVPVQAFWTASTVPGRPAEMGTATPG
jgi:hypothetical protein